MTPPSEVFSDEKDIENNIDNESTTYSIDDDDECVIEDVDDEDSDDDSVEQRSTINKMFRDSDANDNYNIHDQLPSVEEVKASNAYTPTARLIAKSHRRKLYIYIAAAAFAAMVISVSISVGVFETTNKKNSPVVVVESAPEAESRFEAVVQYIYSHRVSTLPSLRQINSPEHHAAQFMALGDAFKSTMTDVDEVGQRRFMERYVLALIYYQTQGQNWSDHYNFLSEYDHCNWHKQYSSPQGRFLRGVQCNDDGHVIDLDLSNSNLVSSDIPQEIVYFKYLESLHLFGNTIGGAVPNFTALKNLKSLGLMNLDLHGTIPSSFGEMTALTTLGLGQTKITKTIPDSIAQLTNLRILGLDGLGLTGSINPVLKLTKLEALYLEDNHLSGEIYYNDWPVMKELDVSNNMIDGRIPENLFHNTNLHVIDLHRNLMFGDFPQKLINNDAIEYVAVQENTITGSLSDRIGYLINLKHLDISGNHMAGTIPDTIQLLTNLVSLSTSGNKFERQPLVDFFTPLVNLQDISLKGNSFTGTLPDFFALMPQLQMLDLDGNELMGSIPSYYGTMYNLKVLQLNRNQLTGTIPSELESLQNLKILLLDGNNLTGKTTEFCSSEKQTLAHFTTDCYPSMNSDAGPEVECLCCTLCCNDENHDCNNKDWSASYDPKAKYGYIRPAYEFSLDQAPEEWRKKSAEEARDPTFVAPENESNWFTATHQSSF